MLHAIVDGSRAWIDPDGLPVTETEAPEAPDGFRATYRIEPSGDGLAQVWELVPLSGTEQEAAIVVARVLPGQSGEAGEWVQPDSTNGYAKGDRVTHLGKTWESDYDGPNVWEPGQPNSHWVEVADGAADA